MKVVTNSSLSISVQSESVHERKTGRPILLCLSHLRWDFVWQRPQQLLTRALKQYQVVFFEEPIFSPVDKAILRIKAANGIVVATPILPPQITEASALAAQRILLDRYLRLNGAPEIVWYYTPMAIPFSRDLGAGTVVYDNMDELSAFRGASEEMLANESELFAQADLVFTGGFSLYEAKRDRHPSVHAFPSSVDSRHFRKARHWQEPEPVDQSSLPGPRLGYFGVVDERFDLPLLERMATLRPDWQFVMIGPVVKIDPASLPRPCNIHWLGQKTYEELPAYLSGWDVGLMPFALNEATRFISPTKTPEFLAAGVPVISTPIADVVRPYGDLDLVAIASSAEEFVQTAERLLAGTGADWLPRVDRHLARGSWDRTWAAMDRLIRAAGAASRGAGRAAVPSLVAAE